MTTRGQKGSGGPRSSPETPQAPRHTFVYDVVLQWGTLLGVVAGIGIGFCAANRHSVRLREGVVLNSNIGAAIGLLEVALAAMNRPGFPGRNLQGRHLTKVAGQKEFFRPFELVAVLSGVAAISGIVSSITSDTRPLNLSSALFGLSVGVLTWAIVQSVQLVFILANHGTYWFKLDSAKREGYVTAATNKLSTRAKPTVTPPQPEGSGAADEKDDNRGN